MALARPTPTNTLSAVHPAASTLPDNPTSSSSTDPAIIAGERLTAESQLGPNGSFPTDPSAQNYPHSTYTYPRGAEGFAIEQDVGMFAAGQHPQLDTMNLPEAPSNGHAPTSEVNMALGTTPGMAPPQTPHQQSFASPTDLRGSIDSAQGMSGEGAKRRRSKISRACDECRRKKIRCDAADDDGSIKTCSNCARADQICQYSRIPMKRGPSKGYIKELSERVQQVESQMAISGGSGNRPSVDGNTYPESFYSPDEPLSLKRNFSFPDPRSNPFNQPQFTDRDRIPSMGGWSNSSISTVPRPRVRSSIALAPDQVADTTTGNEQSQAALSRPYWAQSNGDAPPAKRLKTTDAADNTVSEVDKNLLQSQITLVDAILPIFGDAKAQALDIVRSCPRRLQHAFVFGLALIGRSKDVNNNVFQSYNPIEDFTREQALRPLESCSMNENLTWLWLYCLMIVLIEPDVGRLRDPTSLSKSALLRLAIDVGHHLKSKGSKECLPAYNLTLLLARFHDLSAGTQGLSAFLSPAKIEMAPPYVSYLLHISECLPMLATAIQGPVYESAVEAQSHKFIRQGIRVLTNTGPNLASSDQLPSQFQTFIDLILMRHYGTLHPVEILGLARAIVDALQNQPEVQHSWKLLDMHLYVLSAFTLIECLQSNDHTLATEARTSLIKLRGLLDTKIKSFEPPEGYHAALLWYDALKRHIDSKLGAASDSNGVNSKPSGEQQPPQQQSRPVDYRMLGRVGWMTVLAGVSGL